MPAVARTKPAPRSAAKAPPAKAQPQVQARSRGGKRPPAAPPPPAKLDAARSLGLTPTLALGVASAAVLAVLGAALFTGDRLETLNRGLEVTTARAATALGFGVDAVTIEGASPQTRAAVLAAADVDRGDNILAVNLQGVRERAEAVSWVEAVTVRRLLPDTLAVTVTERRPMAVWQNRGRIALVDATGRVIAGADAARFTQLPLVVGPGAGQAAGAVLPLLHARPRLMERVEALVRVDNRRWDLRLRDGALIQLPALDEENALMRLDQLEQKSHVLELGFAKIDLRDPELVAVRPRHDAPVRSAQAPPLWAPPAPALPATPVPTPAAPAAAGL